MKRRVLIFLMIFSPFAIFSGCAGSKVYLVDLRYISEKKPPPSSALVKPKVAGICPFEDARGVKNKDLIGLRHRHDKSVDFFRIEGIRLSEAVTQAVKDYFVERGFEVTDCKGWDESPNGLDRLPRDLFLVVGGKIESFKIEARSGLAATETHYRIKLVASIGHMKDKQVIIRKNERIPQTKRVGFDPDKIKAALNHTLTNVIQDLFENAY